MNYFYSGYILVFLAMAFVKFEWWYCHPGNLAFPLLLVAGLFLLSQRSQGGMGGPGGGPNPLNFGKSKARFQMEPNTGITFNDVAGVDEAKQDFMEVIEPCA